MKKEYLFVNSGFYLLLFIVFGATVARAQTDNCGAGVAVLTVGSSCTTTAYNVSSAFNNDGPAACSGTSYRDGWFRFTTDATTSSVTISGTGNRQMGLAIYTSCGGASTACTVPGTANATLSASVLPNTTYYLRIMRTNNANANDMTGTICVAKALSNDDCAGATPLTVNTSCVFSTYTNVGATASSGVPNPGCGAYYGGDVWFSAVVPASGTLILDSQTGTLTDCAMALYTGSCGALSLVACDDDSSDNGFMPMIYASGLTPGQTVYIRFWEYNSDAFGTFQLCASTFTGYCPATSTYSGYYISNFSTSGGVQNISNLGSGFSASGYGDFTYQVVSQLAGANINFSTQLSGTSTFGFNVWIDWNNDNDFTDAGELVYASGSYVNQAVGTFAVPPATPVGNYRMRIRANYYSTNPSSCGTIDYGETEDYTLSVVTPPPCSGMPSNASASITSTSSVSVSWTAASPAPANGYQLYYSTSSTSPTSATVPNASTTTLLANLTGLTAGVTYYVWVRANCGGALGTGFWVGPVSFYIPTCGIGNSQGTTTQACPAVVAGGLGLNGADPVPIDCTSGNCVDIEATYLNIGQTTSYTVQSIPYAPPYQFNCLKNPVNVTVDDVWSPVINLPFNFCFYGNSYNKCLMSANGVITFDITNNVPSGPSTWIIGDNLPSPNVFLNSIFGVYHDINPALGGQIGWELITLNTGCRALVAAWNNVPMYSCTTTLYSGMIVCYENTNVIEVYIKEKNLCSSWNNGNAIVGVQNATGTAAVVPANRNGLSTDWAVTNEAWRFVPSGSSLTSIKWYEGSGTSGPVVGTTAVLNVCPTVTTTYTAEVTYNLCNGITLTETEETNVTVNQGKVWNGSSSSNWNTAGNWTPTGVPTNLNCVTIPSGTPNSCVIPGSAFSAYCYNLTVKNGGSLNLNTSNNLIVTDFVNVNSGGTFNISDSASLLQINNIANSGTVSMQRVTQPIYRYDYTYWNSPMTLASNYTLGMLSPATQPDKYYSWMPFVGAGTGNWAQESAATVMSPLKGYIVRAPQTYSVSPSVKVPYTATFVGTPNNGTVLEPVSHGTLGAASNDDKWNLLGNPYPSAINASTLLNSASNTAVLDGTVYFWTHNSAPAATYPDPFYYDFQINYSAADYASWNKLGGVGTMASSGGPAPTGYIAAGQSFFVKSLVPSGNATFNNGMRIVNNNSQFFRAATNDATFSTVGATDLTDDVEKHRIWINMTNNANAFSQILVGYAEGATSGWDRGLDGLRFDTSGTQLYSLLEDDYLVIQGRPLPFDDADVVPLGFSNAGGSAFSIRLDHVDGLFDTQDIYLKDKQLNVLHDLKLSPYNFTADLGRDDGRFELRFTDAALHTDETIATSFAVYIDQQMLYLRASQQIAEVTVYDVSGKKLQTFLPAGDALSQQWHFVYAQGAYLAKVTFSNGISESRKLLNR